MKTAYESDTFFIDLTRLLLRNKQNLLLVGATHSLTGIQAMALLLLDDTDPPTMGHLCKQYMCDAGNMTGIIDGLEEKGLVSRQTSLKDRRLKIIQLEPAGKVMQHTLLKELTGASQELLSVLDTKEQLQLMQLLHKLTA